MCEWCAIVTRVDEVCSCANVKLMMSRGLEVAECLGSPFFLFFFPFIFFGGFPPVSFPASPRCGRILQCSTVRRVRQCVTELKVGNEDRMKVVGSIWKKYMRENSNAADDA